MTRGLHLAAGLHLLQRAQFALFQPKHMDQPAHRVGHIDHLLHCMLLVPTALRRDEGESGMDAQGWLSIS